MSQGLENSPAHAMSPRAARLQAFLSLHRVGRESWRTRLHRDFQCLSNERGVSGWIRRDVSDELYRELAKDLEGFVRSPRVTTLRERPKSKLFRCSAEGPRGSIHNLIIKRVRYDSWFRRLGFLFAASPAFRSLRGALILEERGLATPLPIAAVEARAWRDLGTSYYIAAEVERSQSLRALWQTALPALPRARTLALRRRVLEEAARLCHRLHAHGIFHQDLKGTNILLQDEAPGGHRLFLVDVGDVRERSRLRWRQRLRNLLQLCEIPGRFWTHREKTFFLTRYADLCGMSARDRRALVEEVLRLSAGNRSRPGRSEGRKLPLGPGA